MLGNSGLQHLKAAFDTWCAIWFWPGELPSSTPRPDRLPGPTDEPTAEIAARVAAEHRFFHWELEFPDVFARPGSGFDAVVGNPPWEIQKPNSKEFFSNLDPLYRTYGKQEALQPPEGVLRGQSDADERDWLDLQRPLQGPLQLDQARRPPFRRP